MNKQTQAEQTNTSQTNAQANTKHAASKANIIIHCSIFIIQFNAQYSLFNSIFTICNIILSYSIQLIIQYSLFIIHYSLSIHIRVFIYGPIMDPFIYVYSYMDPLWTHSYTCIHIRMLLHHEHLCITPLHLLFVLCIQRIQHIIDVLKAFELQLWPATAHAKTALRKEFHSAMDGCGDGGG